MIRSSGIRPEDSIELKTILETLYRAKMKVADALAFAEDHADLPELLKSIGQHKLAEFAGEVLSDLRGREDEKKPVVDQSTSRVDTDRRPLRGN